MDSSPALPPDVAAAPESSRFGKFVRMAKLGAGGMGEVWKAWDVELARWVALKFLKGGDDQEVARFKREAQLAGRLSHPNIAAVYDVGVSQERHYIAMQYVEGHTLTRAFANDRRELVRYVRDAARAVAYANAQGIIHRDLKPENVMVTASARGHVYVMDFGLARGVEGAGLTMSGLIVGTPAYMAPEQARGERVDGRADVYGLGATLYELVTGVAPFDGSNVFELLTKAQWEEPRPPRSRNAAIEPDLETIVLKSLQKDAGRRYTDAGALADDLDRFLAGEPIRARRSSLLYRARKSIAKRKIAAAAIVVMLAAIVGAGFMGSRWLDSSRDLGVQRELNAVWTSLVDEKELLRDATQTSSVVFGRLRKAAEAVDEHIRRHPTRPQGYYVRARARVYLLEFDAAERDLRRCLELEPRFAPAEALLGRVLIERGYLLLYNVHQSTRPADALFAEAARWLERAWVGDAQKRSVEEWGLPRSRDDEVSAVLAEAMVQSYVKKDSLKALELLRAADARNPAAEYCNKIGNLLLVQDHIEEAIRAQNDAITRQPHFAMAYLDRGFAKWVRRDVEGSIADYSRAIEIAPWLAVAYINRSVAFTLKGDHRKALEDATRAVELAPDNVMAWIDRCCSNLALGEYAEALRDGDQAVRVDAGTGLGYMHRGNARLINEDLDGALADLNRAIELDPRAGVFFNCRGHARTRIALRCRSRGERDLAAAEWKLAEEDIARAISLAEKRADFWSDRAVPRRWLGNLAGAIADCTQAIELDPHAHLAYVRRGEAYLMLGDYRKAVDDLSKALEDDPRNAGILAMRADALRLRGDSDKAIADCTASLAIAVSADALLSRAQARLDKRDWAEALADANEGLAIAPKRAGLWAVRSTANLELGRPAVALADAAKAIEVDPKEPAGYCARSVVRSRGGDLPGAVRDLDEAIAADDHAWEAWYNRAKIKQAQGNALQGEGKRLKQTPCAIRRSPISRGPSHCARTLRWRTRAAAC